MAEPSIMVTPRRSTNKVAIRVSAIKDLRPAQRGSTIEQRGIPTGSGGAQNILLLVDESTEEVLRLIDEAKRQAGQLAPEAGDGKARQLS